MEEALASLHALLGSIPLRRHIGFPTFHLLDKAPIFKYSLEYRNSGEDKGEVHEDRYQTHL
jgi:hypothetical protein